MKIVYIIVRTLFGLMFMFASIVVLFKLVKEPEQTGKAKEVMDGFAAMGYFMTLLKVTELVCGIAMVIGRFVPLAAVVIFPITLNILFYHIYVDPSGLPVAAPLMLANLFIAYVCRKNYIMLLAAKPL